MKHWTISRLELVKLKKKAVRKGAWYKILDRIDRAVIDLTIRCVERVRSFKLAETVTAILKKLKQDLESPIRGLMKQVGCSLAKKISQVAQSWGNRSATHWAKDKGFTLFLTITYLNTPAIFRT